MPHCKAAGSSRKPPTQHHVTANQPPCQLAAGASERTPKGKESVRTASSTTDLQTKNLKVSASKRLQTSTLETSTLLLPLANKKKQKLADQIRMAIASPTPKQKIKSLPLIQAAKSKQVSKESLEGTRFAKNLLSGSTPFITATHNPRATIQAETRINTDTDLDKDVSLAFSTDTNPKGVPKNKVPRMKKAAESVATTTKAPDSLDSLGIPKKDNLWVNSEEEIENLLVNKLPKKSRSGHQARIVLQDVKAALRRDKTTSQSSRASVLSRTETVDDISNKSRLGSSFSPVTLVTDTTDQASTGSRHALTELQSVEKKSLMCSQASVQHPASPQLKLTSPVIPLLTGHPLSQVSQPALSLPVSMREGLKTGLLSVSPAPSHPLLLAPRMRVKTEERLTSERSQLYVRKENDAHSQTEG